MGIARHAQKCSGIAQRFGATAVLCLAHRASEQAQKRASAFDAFAHLVQSFQLVGFAQLLCGFLDLASAQAMKRLLDGLLSFYSESHGRSTLFQLHG